ncbi:MAG: hypothetical protein Q4A69_00340 [Moraxella sp.]|nr:hypothetical protein [Moraxella sp.]
MFDRRIWIMGCGLLCSVCVFADDTHNTWLDNTHKSTTSWLARTAHRIDDWFGKTDPQKPARASVRVMLDIHHDKYGSSIQPRVRGKLRLPTLEQRLSVMVGDDDLDDEHGGGIHNDGRPLPAGERVFDRAQSSKDNASLALRWSKVEKNLGINSDADIGLRSNDIFLRVQAQKMWQTGSIHGRAEQSYRYGTKSEHFALSTLEFHRQQSKQRTLYNRSHIAYTHKHDDEQLSWSNSSYQQHTWQGKHGERSFSYGVYMSGKFDDNKPTLTTYGPYLSYRQPLWREWLFVQTDISYYNDKKHHKNHHLAGFGRIEMVF